MALRGNNKEYFINLDNSILVNGKVGQYPGADGSGSPLRMDRQSNLMITNAHGKYHEAAVRGKLFCASIGVGGVAPGTALSTSPALILWNPANSGILVSIKQVFVGYVSGTLGAGMLVHAQNASQATLPSGGTALVPVCALLNGTSGSAKALTGSTISATSTLIRPSMTMGAALATSVAFDAVAMDEVDGAIVIPAGVAWCYQGIAAAGTSPLLAISVLYEELNA